MGSSVVDTCNLALTFLGVGNEIASLTERGQEAQACNRVADRCIDEVLRASPWPFATKNIPLGLVTDSSDDNHPTTEYTYSYRYPSTCLNARRILSEVRNDSRASRWTYAEMADDQGTLIVTDKEDAVLECTSTDGRNPARWSADFETALAYLIAHRIAPRLTKGDPFKLSDRMFALYRQAIAAARANAANEVQPDEDPESEFILARN